MPVDPDMLVAMNTPTLMKEKVKCQCCGNIVPTGNYCQICDCKL